MRLSRTRVTAAAACLGLLIVMTASRPMAVQEAGGRARADAILQAAVDRHDIPGVVAAATDRRGTFYTGAAGAAESASSRPLTADAIFRIASMTKPITSVAAMQLVEQKRLALEDPVAKYLPQFSSLAVLTAFDPKTGEYTVQRSSKAVAVRHLLTHTSGLGYAFTSAIVRDFKPKAGDQFDVGPLMFEPGERWLYGTSTDWVGRLVEKISGQTLEAYLEEHILNPLGMVDTHFNVPESKLPRLVDVWRRDASGALVAQPRQTPTRVTQFNGGGGLSSTAADYLRFIRMLLNDGQGERKRILSAETVAAMSRNQIGDVGVRELQTAQPGLSRDFTFVRDNRDKWGLGFQISTEPGPGLRSAGSLSWGGIDNTYFWVDRARGIGGVILMQFLPFADERALATYESFERAVYQWPPNTR